MELQLKSDHEYVNVNGDTVSGADIQDLKLPDISCQIIRYKKDTASLMHLFACLLKKTSFLILDDSWAMDFNDSLCALVADIDSQEFKGTFFIATSGSTGAPKLCCHSIDSLFLSVQRSLSVIPIVANDSIILSLSPAHMGGLLTVTKALVTSATLYLSNSWIDSIQPKNSHFMLVPQQIQTLINALSGSDFGLVKSILIGGDVMSEGLRQQLLDLALPVTVSYGLTETCGQITALDLTKLDSSSGTPLAGVDLMISDHCLAVKTLSLAKGYLHDAGFDPLLLNNGFYQTSDLAEISSDGHLIIRGRRDLLFNTGAELVSPEVIEARLLTSGLIGQIIVVPKPDQRFGLIPVAFIDSLSDLDELRSFANLKLPLFMRPKEWLLFPPNIDQTAKTVRKQCLDYVSGLNSEQIDLK